MLNSRYILIFFGIFWSVFLYAGPVINVYNWSNYVPASVLKEFERETGIHVNYTTYDENETLYTKMKADPHIGYDVVFPSSYYVQRMAMENMLQALDYQKLPNVRYLNHLLLNRSYDPHNQYSLPYLWGTSGIIVNKKYVNPLKVRRWEDLWSSDWRGKVLVLNDIRDVFSVALVTLGYSINTENPNEIKQAYLKLKALLPNVKLFNNEAVIPIYIDEDAVMGMILNGDAEEAIQGNSALSYIYPADGVVAWVDCMVIPKYAPHPDAAYVFMNFLMRPDIAAKISATLGYSTPNQAAISLLPKSLQKDPVINPPQSLLQGMQIEGYVSDRTSALYSAYWNLLKLSA